MATTDEIHVGDIGTVFVITVKEGTTPVDISGAAVKEILIQRRDKTVIEVTDAEFATVSYGGAGDGSDGKLMYAAVAGDLSIKGDYKIQAIIQLANGLWHSSIEEFTVYENITVP